MIHPVAFWRPDVVHFEASYLARSLYLDAAGMCGFPVVISLRGADVDEKPVSRAGWQDWLCSLNVRQDVWFHCVSHYVRARAVALGIEPSKCAVVYQGVDPADYGTRAPSAGASGPRNRLVVTGRLCPEKGVDVAARALASFGRDGSDLSLHVIGDGPQRRELGQLAEKLEVSQRVVFHGEQTNDWVRSFLTANCDTSIYLQPSRREALGQALLEAMAARLPVVASNVGGIPEVVEDNVTGLLVQPEDHQALAAQIARLRSTEELVQTLIDGASAKLRRQFGADREASGFLDLYTRVADRGSGTPDRVADCLDQQGFGLGVGR